MRARQGRPQEAIEAISEAIALSRAQSCPLMEARLLKDLGMILDHEGDSFGAAENQRNALAIFDRLGAKLEAQHLRATLTALRQGVGMPSNSG